jgi:FkbM family methyltransferase
MMVWRSWLRPGDLFVDVGAHAGVYTIWALDIGARVLAVEPEPEMVAQLRENLVLNHYDAEVVEAALSDGPGRMQLVGPDLQRRHLALEPSADPSLTVAVRTLDDVLGDRHARGVKIDVEGAERLVLEGASRALGDRRIDLLQLEWNDRSAALLDEDRAPVASLLRDHGYELVRPDDTARLLPPASIAYGKDMFARPT